MDNDKKKALKEQYKNRHPKMGIITWQYRDNLWAEMSTDADADFNGTSFQLKLGSWPNKALQAAYKENPDECKFSLAAELEYEDYSDDHSDDLKIMLMDYLHAHPDAKPMRVRFNL